MIENVFTTILEDLPFLTALVNAPVSMAPAAGPGSLVVVSAAQLWHSGIFWCRHKYTGRDKTSNVLVAPWTRNNFEIVLFVSLVPGCPARLWLWK